MMQSDGLWSGPIHRPKRSLPRPMVTHLPAKYCAEWLNCGSYRRNLDLQGRNDPQLNSAEAARVCIAPRFLGLHWL